MKEFKDLEHEPHSTWSGGTQAKMFFDNGYGVSVVRGGMGGGFSGSYGSEEGLYEMAVVKGSAADWRISYDTPITSDVVGSLSESEVTDYMRQVQELEAA